MRLLQQKLNEAIEVSALNLVPQKGRGESREGDGPEKIHYKAETLNDSTAWFALRQINFLRRQDELDGDRREPLSIRFDDQ